MSRLDELIAELCPDGVEYKKLDSICGVYDGTHQTPKYTSSGIKFVSVENIADPFGTNKYISEEEFGRYKVKPQMGDVLMTRIGTIGVCTVLDHDEPLAYYVSLALLRPKRNYLDSKFLKYAIESLHGRKELRKWTLVNAVPIKINTGDIGKITIPVPPLTVQQEIVHILDHFTELTAELQKQLIKEEQLLSVKQKYYLNKLVSSNIQYETRQLRDLMNVRMCKRIQKNQTVSNGSIPFYKNGTLGKEADTYIPVELYEEYKAKYPYPEKGAVMLSTAGTVGRAWIFDGKPAYFQDSNVVWLENDENFVSNEYLYWFCLSMPWKLPSRGTIKHLHNDMILDTYISVPPLHIQNDCINFLKAAINNFELMRDSLLSEISIRQKQYEYYRDKLLTFKELPKS